MNLVSLADLLPNGYIDKELESIFINLDNICSVKVLAYYENTILITTNNDTFNLYTNGEFTIKDVLKKIKVLSQPLNKLLKS